MLDLDLEPEFQYNAMQNAKKLVIHHAVIAVVTAVAVTAVAVTAVAVTCTWNFVLLQTVSVPSLFKI
jgi:hypothetical protein